MIYRSNLSAPDLQPHFRHAVSRVMGHSFGHDVLSDWGDKDADDPVFGIYTRCGFWTHDEAAILYTIAKERGGGMWLDIGAHTGWTAAHAIAAGANVACVEPMLRLDHWQQRFEANLDAFWKGLKEASYQRSDEYLRMTPLVFDGAIIDGDHNHPWPLLDASLCDSIGRKDKVILFHDAIGGPVWRGIEHLLDAGYRCHVYLTPHVVACCYRGFEWTPPAHECDPAINWREIQTNHMKGFPWDRVTHDTTI